MIKIIIRLPLDNIPKKQWLEDNLGGPVNYEHFAFNGPNWSIEFSLSWDGDYIVIGEFDDEEHAVLFQLTWEK